MIIQEKEVIHDYTASILDSVWLVIIVIGVIFTIGGLF